MKKQSIIIGVILVLIIVGFSGCFTDDNVNKENGESSESNLFIGKWKTTIFYLDQNRTRHDEQPSNSTFYTNGTMGSESVEDNSIIWTPYFVENNEICFGDVNDSEYLCYYYEFSDDGSKATLVTYITNPYSEYGETYELIIEMTKI